MNFLATITEILNIGAENLGQFLISILISLGAVGVIAMAVIEALKALFTRGLFNAYFFRRFIKSPEARELIYFACLGGDHKTFLLMKVDQIVEHIQQVVQSALNYPGSMGGSLVVDIASANFPEGSDHQIAQIEHDWKLLSDDDLIEEIRYLKDRDEARERLQTLISSNLNGFKMLVTFRWQLSLKITAIIISAVLIWFLLPADYSNPLGRIVFTFLGGMIAPVAHNILSIIGPNRHEF